MQRVRRDSASSTDSWSIIEQRCSPVISSEDSLDTDVSDSESEIEIAEEAYDSHDSDIEVDENDLTEDEEEEEAPEEEKEPNSEEEVSDSEEQIPETEENVEWLTQKEAMEGEGKRYVVPEKIKGSLDSYIEKKANARKIALFMGCSFAFFVIQNLALMYLLSFTDSHARGPPEQNWGIMKTTKAVAPFESLFLSPGYQQPSLQCWVDRAPKGWNGTVKAKSCRSSIVESWQNLTDLYMQRCWYRQKPTVIKGPRPTSYGHTTISRQKTALEVCKRRDSPPTLSKSLYPCDQMNPMPTPPKMKQPQSPFSALKSIIGQSVKKTETMKIIVPQKNELPCQRLFKTSPKPKPRARTFNYKMEMSPAPRMSKAVKKELIPRPQYTPVEFKKQKVAKSHSKCPARASNVSKEVMVLPREWKMTKIRRDGNFKPRKMMEKKRFSMKASQLMRNSSYNSDRQQCKRHEFKQFRRQQLEDKSHRRQRLVEYKIEKPCRAIYEAPVTKSSKKFAKLEAKIQKKIQKIEKRIQKRKASLRV